MPGSNDQANFQPTLNKRAGGESLTNFVTDSKPNSPGGAQFGACIT